MLRPTPTMAKGLTTLFSSFDWRRNASLNVLSADEELHERTILLEEHDRLTISLSALTRHFAHVQLRLQQVVSAPTSEDREVRRTRTATMSPWTLLILAEFIARTA